MGFDRLLTSVSPRFASLEPDQLAPALDYALEQVCLAMHAERTIIEFNGDGTIETSHSRQRPGLEALLVDASGAGDGSRRRF